MTKSTFPTSDAEPQYFDAASAAQAPAPVYQANVFKTNNSEHKSSVFF
jgi:hypothetical protein